MKTSGLSASSFACPAPELTLIAGSAEALPASGGFVSVVLVRVMVELVERRGFSSEALLRAIGLDREGITGFEARIELSRFRTLLAHAARITSDPAFGLHLGAHSSEVGFALVGHLIQCSTTLRQAISACKQFRPLFMDDGQLLFSEHAGIARIRCVFPRGDAATDASLAEFAVAGLMRLVRLFAGSRAQIHVACFEHARPDHGLAYNREFGGAERFRRPFTGIELASDLLDRPQLHANPELHALLRAQAEQSLARLSRPVRFADRLRPLLAAHGAQSAPDMQRAARELGMSVRSLRRRLDEEGVSFRALAQDALKARASLLLRDPEITLQEAAHALGFADVTAFHRAFKRWTGSTPLEFRARLQT